MSTPEDTLRAKLLAAALASKTPMAAPDPTAVSSQNIDSAAQTGRAMK